VEGGVQVCPWKEQKICSVWKHAHRFDQIGSSREYQAKRINHTREEGSDGLKHGVSAQDWSKS
jgi:hypothetical protein